MTLVTGVHNAYLIDNAYSIDGIYSKMAGQVLVYEVDDEVDGDFLEWETIYYFVIYYNENFKVTAYYIYIYIYILFAITKYQLFYN